MTTNQPKLNDIRKYWESLKPISETVENHKRKENEEERQQLQQKIKKKLFSWMGGLGVVCFLGLRESFYTYPSWTAYLMAGVMALGVIHLYVTTFEIYKLENMIKSLQAYQSPVAGPDILQKLRSKIVDVFEACETPSDKNFLSTLLNTDLGAYREDDLIQLLNGLEHAYSQYREDKVIGYQREDLTIDSDLDDLSQQHKQQGVLKI